MEVIEAIRGGVISDVLCAYVGLQSEKGRELMKEECVGLFRFFPEIEPYSFGYRITQSWYVTKMVGEVVLEDRSWAEQIYEAVRVGDSRIQDVFDQDCSNMMARANGASISSNHKVSAERINLVHVCRSIVDLNINPCLSDEFSLERLYRLE